LTLKESNIINPGIYPGGGRKAKPESPSLPNRIIKAGINHREGLGRVKGLATYTIVSNNSVNLIFMIDFKTLNVEMITNKLKSLFRKKFQATLGSHYNNIPDEEILKKYRESYINHGCDWVNIVSDKKLNVKNAWYSMSFAGSFWGGIRYAELTISDANNDGSRAICLVVYMHRVIIFTIVNIIIVFIILNLTLPGSREEKAGKIIFILAFLSIVQIVGIGIKIMRFNSHFLKILRLMTKEYDQKNLVA
jgi:hypothetical protein